MHFLIEATPKFGKQTPSHTNEVICGISRQEPNIMISATDYEASWSNMDADASDIQVQQFSYSPILWTPMPLPMGCCKIR